MSSNTLRFCTYNIRNTTDRYPERKPYLAQSIRDLEADIIAFQEVAWNQIPLLQDSCGVPSTVHRSPAKDPILSRSKPDYRVDGDLLLVRNISKEKAHIQVLSEDVLILSFERVVQRALLKITPNSIAPNNSEKRSYLIWVSNTHLHNGLSKSDEAERVRQATLMMNWLEAGEAERKAHSSVPLDGFVVMGDFNSNQKDQTYEYMLQKGFVSSYKDVCKSEPTTTFPSGLQAPSMDTDPDIGCVDFIFIKGNCFVPLAAGIGANKPAPHDPTIYPSDHYAVWVDITLQ